MAHRKRPTRATRRTTNRASTTATMPKRGSRAYALVHGPEPSGQAFLRRDDVVRKTGLSKSTLYTLIKAGGFPRAVRLTGAQAVGWLASDVDRWITERVAVARKAAE